jgi:hypothetical protein
LRRWGKRIKSLQGSDLSHSFNPWALILPHRVKLSIRDHHLIDSFLHLQPQQHLRRQRPATLPAFLRRCPWPDSHPYPPTFGFSCCSLAGSDNSPRISPEATRALDYAARHGPIPICGHLGRPLRVSRKSFKFSIIVHSLNAPIVRRNRMQADNWRNIAITLKTLP